MTAPTTEGAAEQPSLWRNRDFVALWSGQVVSTLGAQISGTAMPLLVLATTGSPSDAGIVGAAGTAPFLIANLPAGALVDRRNRRRILLISEIFAGLALSTVPMAMWWDVLTVAHLAVVAFVQGLCFVFFGLAERAALPTVVPLAPLSTAVAHNEARSHGAALAGPPPGGMLFGIDRAAPFPADAVSYVIASVGLLFVRGNLRNRSSPPSEPLWRATTTGLRWVWRHPLIRAAILLITVSDLVFQILVLTLVVPRPAPRRHIHDRRHDARHLQRRRPDRRPRGEHAPSSLQAQDRHRRRQLDLGRASASLRPHLEPSADRRHRRRLRVRRSVVERRVVITTYATALVPDELLGRVTSAAMTLSSGVMPVASLGAGYLLTGLGPIGSVCVLTTVMLITAIASSVSPAVRHAPPLPAHDESA
ncbi:MFS transporter [Streptomyces sp. NPDC006527]|uniref:MFS transporter n=1 Tax=Streptomyces sp. NPDC006527 TaxID=3364749 RepID=UPI0036998DBC